MKVIVITPRTAAAAAAASMLSGTYVVVVIVVVVVLLPAQPAGRSSAPRLSLHRWHSARAHARVVARLRAPFPLYISRC